MLDTFSIRERLAHVDERVLADGDGSFHGVAVEAGPGHARGRRVGHVDHDAVKFVTRLTDRNRIEY